MAPVKETLELTVNYYDTQKSRKFGRYITGTYSSQLQNILAQKIIDKFLTISRDLGIQQAEPIGNITIQYRTFDVISETMGQLKMTFDYSIPNASRKTQQLKQSLIRFVNSDLLDAVLAEFEAGHRQRIRKDVQRAKKRSDQQAVSQPAGAQLKQDQKVRKSIRSHISDYPHTPSGIDWSKAQHSPESYMPVGLPRPYSLGEPLIKQAPPDPTQSLKRILGLTGSKPPTKQAPPDPTQSLKRILGLTGSKPPTKQASPDPTQSPADAHKACQANPRFKAGICSC